MNNIYVIETSDYDLIKLKVLEILKDKKLSLDKLITYDMEEVNISKAIMDLDTYDFLNEGKIVHCVNSQFLTANKSEINHDIEILSKYINNPNVINVLILSCSKMDGKKNIVKLLKEKANIMDVNLDLKSYVKSKTKSYKMTSETINYLIDNLGNDLERINNELDKLMSLKEKEKEITIQDIDLISIKKMDNNIFSLIDAIINKDKKKSLKIYNEMINYGEDIFKLFVSLSNQIRLIYSVKVLRDLPNDEISTILQLRNPKQVVALRYKIDKYQKSDLLHYLHQLALLDEEIKTGKSIDRIVFPIFIANL